MSSSTKKSTSVGSNQKSEKNENSVGSGSGSKGDSVNSTPSKASKHGVSKKSGASAPGSNKSVDSAANNPAVLNQQALESLYSATYVEDFIDCNDNMGDDLIRQTTRMFEMGSNYMTYIRELESAMAILLGEDDADRIIPDQLSSDKKKAVFRLQQVLMTAQDTGDDSLQVMQSIQDYLENKNRQLELDRKNLAEFCKEQDTPDTPFKDPPPPPTERNIKRARRQRHEIYRPSILGPSSLKATSYPESCTNNQREQPDTHVVTSSRSRDRDSQSKNESSNQASATVNSQSSSDGSTAGATEEHKSNGRSSERGVSSTRSSASANSADRERDRDRDHKDSNHEKSERSSSGNTPSSSSKKQSQKTPNQEKKTKKRKAKQGGSSSNSKDDNSPQQYAIDPDEPTYCLCDQVSYGEMIGCDNDLCPIEWFHFSCVHLTTKPKGKWFCPKCRGDRPNIMKPRHIFLKELEKYNREKEEKA